MNKIVWTLLTVWSAALGAFATDYDSRKRDSVIVNFGDKTKIVIYAERKEDFQKLLKYDLNALLRDIGAKIDTVSKKGETRISIEEDARRYQKDSIRGKDDNYVRIGIKGIHIKDGADEVHISTSGIRVKDGKDVVNIGVDVEVDSTNNGRKSTSNKNSWRLKSSDFALSLGLNNYLGANGQSAGNQSSEYDLRPFGSRYFSMAFNRRLTIAKGKNAALRLKSGVEFSWYNFMFEGNNVAVKGTQRVEFPESTKALSKSKLTVPYINIPMMPYVSFRQGAITHIGAGGYVGYRLGGYTKTKQADGGKKDHVRSNYYLNDFRYGLVAEIGFRKAPDFFFQYDLNRLFADNRGPQLNAVSFGIRL
jgi:hypothetical protein